MTEQEVKLLLRKYNNGQSTLEERALLENWYVIEGKNQQFSDDEIDLSNLRDEIWEGVLKRAKLSDRNSRKKMSWIQIAATIVVVMSIGSYFYFNSTASSFTVVELSSKSVDINPGGNKATLTLADGQVVDLNNDKEGIIVNMDGLTYVDGTEIFSVNTEPDANILGQVRFNTITTPKGGQYRIVLPDGSRVWLNAASTLKYPTSFNDERRVELIGEAYFEVEQVKSTANNQPKPFIVQSSTQEVVVLGTHFNVNTYEDEVSATTTLIEGAVDVLSLNDREPRRLVPGQQSIVQKGKKIQVLPADIDESIAWKNGEFVFYNESIENVMKKIARWYDIDVVYKDPVKHKMIWGSVSKFKNISEVLRMIELAGTVRFEVNIKGNERRVYVMN